MHGSASSRLRSAEEAIPVLRQEMNRFGDTAHGKCREYAATWEAWTSRVADEAMRPLAIERDVRDARLVKGVAWGLTLSELALSFFLALLFLVNPVFVLLLALVGIFSLKAGLLALWRDDAQPQRTRARLRRWVLGPSLAVTLAALMVLLFTRGVMGWLALLLLPLLNAALFALSLGVLGLAAGLFALGYLLSWSLHAEQRYNAIEREAVETRRVLQKAEQVAAELRRKGNGGHGATGSETSAALVAMAGSEIIPLQQQETPKKARAAVMPHGARGGGNFLSLLLMFAVLCGSGCGLGETSPDGGAGTMRTAAEPVSLELWLDWSLSAEAQPYNETLRAFVAALPGLVKRHGISRITAMQFSDRAWSAPSILDLVLPAPPFAASQSESGTLFGQITVEQQKQAEEKYQADLDKALAIITPEKLLPAEAIEPPCTDVQGVLERIAASAGSQRRLIFVVTDGQENCAAQLRLVAMAEANAALVIVLLPEGQGTGKTLRPDEQWRLRRDALLQAAPGTVVMPHFGNWAAAAGEAWGRL